MMVRKIRIKNNVEAENRDPVFIYRTMGMTIWNKAEEKEGLQWMDLQPAIDR